MGSVGTLRFFSSRNKQESRAPEFTGHTLLNAEDDTRDSSGSFLHTIGWLSAGAGALGIGLVIGRELRQRYKFNRRTPYDVYAHAGDYKSDLEFGVGI